MVRTDIQIGHLIYLHRLDHEVDYQVLPSLSIGMLRIPPAPGLH